MIEMASYYKSMFVRILICLEISLCFTTTMAMDLSTKRFCGHVLTESLALICDGEYETIIKRSDDSFEDDVYNDQAANAAATFIDELPIQYQTYAYLSKLLPESAALRPRARRDWMYTRHGVYDECCRKPCSFQELKSYCKRKN